MRFADNLFSGNIGVYLGIDQGYFQAEGLDVELVTIKTTPEGIPQLAGGQVQVIQSGPDPAISNALDRGVDMRILAAATKGKPGDRTAAVLVRKDLIDSGKVKSAKDLRGMSIAEPALQSQWYIEKYLAEDGLTANDVKIVMLPVADIPAAMANKAIDAAWEIEPQLTSAINQNIGVAVAAVGDLLPGAISSTVIVNAAFSQQQPEALRRYMVVWLRGMREYYHALNKKDTDPTKVLASLTKHTALKDANVYMHMATPNFDPNATMNTMSWDILQDYFIKQGLQKTRIDFNKYIDPTFLNYALDQLGRE